MSYRDNRPILEDVRDNWIERQTEVWGQSRGLADMINEGLRTGDILIDVNLIRDNYADGVGSSEAYEEFDSWIIAHDADVLLVATNRALDQFPYDEIDEMDPYEIVNTMAELFKGPRK